MMSNWIPLHLHTHYSLLDGLSKPIQVARRCSDLGYEACAITDHGTISGVVSFTKSMRSKGIKPILGCEFYICKSDPTIRKIENRSLNHLVVLAKNKAGWETLLKLTSRSNDEDVFYFKPRIDLNMLSHYNEGKNLIGFSGHMGSDLASILFEDCKLAYDSKTYEEAEALLRRDWKEQATALAVRHRDIFGEGNFFIEIQLIDKENSPASEVISKCLREVSRFTGIPPLATADSHYPTKEDAVDQRILLCSGLKTTIKKVEVALASGEDVALSCFFRSNNYHIPSPEEIEVLHTEEEISNTKLVADSCEDYTILGNPMLPKYTCPDGMEENEYLKQLCRKGWRKFLINTQKIDSEEKKNTYLNTVLKEFKVIQAANLAGYLLIVRDIVEYVKAQGWLPGPGRGSAAGSLVSYLVGITQIDPIEFNLIFERFYNAGRNTKDHVSLPDIDIDVPTEKREQVIEYIKNKYEKSNVGQMVTFGRLQGRSALKEVLRVHDACSFEEMNSITKQLPQEHEISDQLQDMDEEDRSIIRWTLINHPDALEDYCKIDEEQELSGKYAKLFEQAMRIEGTYKSQGKHAAGVVISSQNLGEVCPMVRETAGSEKIAGMEMEDLEAMGHVKFDILGINLLDKVMGIKNQLLTGVI